MKYRKIHDIDAFQFTEDMVLGLTPLPNGVRLWNKRVHQENRTIHDYDFRLDSLEQKDVPVLIGNWVATGVKGEHWVIQNDVFVATYVPAANLAPELVREVKRMRDGISAALMELNAVNAHTPYSLSQVSVNLAATKLRDALVGERRS